MIAAGSKDRREEMAYQLNWKVVSSVDDGDVFPPESVSRYAREHNISKRDAARRLARDHEDPLTDEALAAVLEFPK